MSRVKAENRQEDYMLIKPSPISELASEYPSLLECTETDVRSMNRHAVWSETSDSRKFKSSRLTIQLSHLKADQLPQRSTPRHAYRRHTVSEASLEILMRHACRTHPC